jgi:hypothetical protein
MKTITRIASAAIPIPIPAFAPMLRPFLDGAEEAGGDVAGTCEVLVVEDASVAEAGLEDVDVGEEPV